MEDHEILQAYHTLAPHTRAVVDGYAKKILANNERVRQALAPNAPARGPLDTERGTITKPCAYCGQEFVSTRGMSFKYCSIECRKKRMHEKQRTRYHTNERARQRQIQNSRDWNERNPEHFKEIQYRYRLAKGLITGKPRGRPRKVQQEGQITNG